MSEVPKWVVCVRLAMSESLSRRHLPSAEGRGVHGAGGARRRADACRRFAFGRVTKEDDAPDRAAGTGRDTGRDNVRDDSPKSVAAGPRVATDHQRPAAHLTHQLRHASRSGRGAAVAALLVFAVLGTALPAAAQSAGNGTGHGRARAQFLFGKNALFGRRISQKSLIVGYGDRHSLSIEEQQKVRHFFPGPL